MSNEHLKPDEAPMASGGFQSVDAAKVVADDFSAPDCCVDEPISSDSKIKKYGLLTLVLLLFLGLFAGILMRTDAALDQVAAIRQEVLAASEANAAQAAQLEALLAQAVASFQDLDSKLSKASSVGEESVAALNEIRSLYKETSDTLKETLFTRDQLIRELIGSLRTEASDEL